MAPTVTWRALAAEVAADLAGAGIDSAEIDARRLVEEASGAEGAEYHDVLDREATRRGVAALEAMAARRSTGEPLQYVIGRWGFRELDLFVDRRVLIPRPETEVVVGCALDELTGRGPGGRRVVDLGTGSGAIALSIAVECPSAEVWATDRSADALAVARANLAGTGRAAARVTLAHGSWFEALPDELRGAVDLVVANPPYVAADDDLPPVVARWEPHAALISGTTGLECLEQILDEVGVWLAPAGAVVLELAPHQGPAVQARAESAGLVDVTVRPDLAGRDRVLVAHRSP